MKNANPFMQSRAENSKLIVPCVWQDERDEEIDLLREELEEAKEAVAEGKECVAMCDVEIKALRVPPPSLRSAPRPPSAPRRPAPPRLAVARHPLRPCLRRPRSSCCRPRRRQTRRWRRRRRRGGGTSWTQSSRRRGRSGPRAATTLVFMMVFMKRDMVEGRGSDPTSRSNAKWAAPLSQYTFDQSPPPRKRSCTDVWWRGRPADVATG
jgi:hypothetical protein